METQAGCDRSRVDQAGRGQMSRQVEAHVSERNACSVTCGGDPVDQALLQSRLQDWRPDLIGTLMFIRDADRVLLIHKRRGHGAGRINGPGGKLEPDESPLACALRDTVEETGVVAIQPVRVARMRFLDTEGPDWLGHVFLASGYTGTPVATDEALPEWFPLAALPLDRMWPDDALWLPRILAGEQLAGDFLFAAGVLRAWTLGPLAL